MDNFIQWLQHIDRRWIYLALLIGLFGALIAGKRENPIIMKPVQDLFDQVQKAKTSEVDPVTGETHRKIVIVSVSFGASTLTENGNQTRAVLRHLMLLHKPFALLAMSEPQGELLGRTIANDLAAQYGYKYGTDWICFAYKLGTLAFLTSFPRDIPNTIKTDAVEKRPLTNFPLMKGIVTIRDNVSLLVEITPSSTAGDWIAIVQGKYSLKLGYGCTGVMAAEAYPWLDSGQLVGMMPGMKGAADYEKLVDDLETQEIANGHQQHRYDPTTLTQLNMKPARQLMFAQGVAHLVIIGFIILGNIGVILSRLTNRKRKGAQQS